MSESFLKDKITLHCGDCLEVLPTLAENSVDACVTDPPYHLTSVIQRFGKEGSANNQFGSDARYQRAAAGFMGKQWDGGDIAFRPEIWREVYRVLKPGAHLLAFGGTRTFHRMACAIEDAGFEIRDTIMWVYGQGFPKSHDVSKGIDRVGGMSPREQAGLLRRRRELKRITRAEIAAKVGCTVSSIRDWEQGRSRATGLPVEWVVPSENYRTILANLLDYSKDERRLVGATTNRRDDGTIIGLGHSGQLRNGGNTDAAREWQGWGTALKPACEPIVLARKPLSEGTVAANVLRWGVGAINIDKCRIGVIGQRPWEDEQNLCASCAGPAVSTTKLGTPATKESIATRHVGPTLSERDEDSPPDTDRQDTGCSDGTRMGDTSTSSSIDKSGRTHTAQSPMDTKFITSTETKGITTSATCALCGQPITVRITNENTMRGRKSLLQGVNNNAPAAPVGRWPSNLIHDGSEEVVAGFPETESGSRSGEYANGTFSSGTVSRELQGDCGSAARFFYTAKADSDDRLGSKHPTVKPLDLIQYLCRLVCPKGELILDPFAGTGTTGEAAWREGMRAVLIEREAEYQADIRRRMALALAGPDERVRESIKEKTKGKDIDHGPLFSRIP